MNAITYASLCFYLSRVSYSADTMESPFTISVPEPGEGSKAGEEKDKEEGEDEREERGEIEAVPTTEQVMDPNIRITDVPDVEESSEDSWDANWDVNRIIRDLAYYIRAHKFHDYDRRYYRSLEESRGRLYEEFPDPPLRSLHWEVRRHCEASFVECLKYVEGVVKLTPLKREDDTVTIMKEQKWNFETNAEQIRATQRDCQTARRRDNLTMIPFQGPIERFQWRTTVSYYMCWYTMLGVPELSIFGEGCDNHADCRVEAVGGNRDPRADDTKPYACAVYSFCPDHCCPMERIRDMMDCYQSPRNPCYAGNTPARRECRLDRARNRDFASLISNRLNISCECPEAGYEWSSRFGLCVDVNECGRGEHSCSAPDGEACMNTPGGYECVCVLGRVYEPARGECVSSRQIEEILAGEKVERVEPETGSLLDAIVRTIARSAGSCLAIDAHALLHAILWIALFTRKY